MWINIRKSDASYQVRSMVEDERDLQERAGRETAKTNLPRLFLAKGFYIDTVLSTRGH